MNVRWHWLSHTQTFSLCDSLGSSDRSRGHKALVPRQLTQWLRSRVSLRVSPKYRRVSTVWFMPGLRFAGLFCHSQGKKRNGWRKETFLLSGGNVERWCIFFFFVSMLFWSLWSGNVFFLRRNHKRPQEGLSDRKGTFITVPFMFFCITSTPPSHLRCSSHFSISYFGWSPLCAVQSLYQESAKLGSTKHGQHFILLL